MRVEKHADQHTFAQVKKIISWNDVSKCRAGRRARACKADQKPEKDSRKCCYIDERNKEKHGA